MKALLLVDIQNDFLPGGTLPVPRGDEIIPVVNALIPRFELVVATQDWHPEGHSSFASTWPAHCVQGSRGAEFPESLNTGRIEAVIRKGTDPAVDSYSGFFDNDHLKGTGLAEYLQGRGARHLYVAGLAADVCVYFTILDALKLGFQVTLVKDATRALTEEGLRKRLKELESKGCGVEESGSIVSVK